ncbi:predicted protein [Pyrenophora tritici-repentis Pt-1C-BFP]|uniref:Uncharacterized protein n=1 Tax=Pyrenophora tritici-repentis (strain Pt-1C-BFP) TaxID=426418 RepID=B2WKR5_PYRTR|nr:uncharacterized protein PTRG_10575 [Pyrenophora tritici-repentis Pt-1C-BFP]EDU43625.1 predicted protein [Pyrenophora tritici-repentis Pt-1C-BFP]
MANSTGPFRFFSLSRELRDAVQSPESKLCYPMWMRVNRLFLSEAIQQFYRNFHLRGHVPEDLPFLKKFGRGLFDKNKQEFYHITFAITTVYISKAPRVDLSSFKTTGFRLDKLVVKVVFPTYFRNYGLFRVMGGFRLLVEVEVKRLGCVLTLVNHQFFKEATNQFYRNHTWTAEVNGDVGNPLITIHSELGLKDDFDDIIYAMEHHFENAPALSEDRKVELEPLRIGIDESIYTGMPILSKS